MYNKLLEMIDMANQMAKYEKATKYDYVKKNKTENFTFLNRNFCKKGQTILFGDSITEIFNHYELFYAYTEKTGQAVYNRGISGDTSNRLLERLYDNALILEPKNLVILIGTNDIGCGFATPEYIALNVQRLIKETKEKSPKTHIILEAVYPVNKLMNVASVQMVGRRTNKDIATLNALLKEVAENEDVTFLDLTNELSNRKGTLAKEYCYDGLHLNAHGFKVVAEHIIPLLKK